MQGFEEAPSSPSSPISQNVSAFEKELRDRDQICGVEICVLCGWMHDLEPCYIVSNGEGKTEWREFQVRKYAPPGQSTPKTEPRNAILMCPTHRAMFEGFQAFVRYSPQTKAYIWFEFPSYQGKVVIGAQRHILAKSSKTFYHGKKLHLDPNHALAPFHSLFLIHEWEARGEHPFDKQDTNPQAPEYSASLLDLKVQILDGGIDGMDSEMDVTDEMEVADLVEVADEGMLQT
ncbi:hypothetical protein DFH06DRAFT_1191355 [Mycena polygramma]|nr:hypothetical protein DFH06DRAFT_1191355 [Mycena polygramma]